MNFARQIGRVYGNFINKSLTGSSAPLRKSPDAMPLPRVTPALNIHGADPLRLVMLFIRAVPILLFLAGCGLAVHFAGVSWHPKESTKAAATLLRHGYVGNPYLLPAGPTAHVSPILAYYMAFIYAIFGVNSWLANVVLGIVAAAGYAFSVILVFRLLFTLRVSTHGLWLAIFVVLGFSLFLYYMVTYCHDWEEPFSSVILIYGWLILEKFRTAANQGAIYVMAALAGFGGLLSPVVLPSLFLALLLMLWWLRPRFDQASRVNTWSSLARRAVLCGLIIAAFLVPWGIRNEILLGKFIITRSNFGLELALGNQPGAQGPTGIGWTAPIHPSVSLQAARQVQVIGEVRYMARMSKLAKHWILADPARFVRLTLTRIWISFLPEPDMKIWFPIIGSTIGLALLILFGVLKLLAIAGSLVLRIRPVEMILFSVLPLAPYFITHVYLRYEIPSVFPSMALMVIVADAAWRRFRRVIVQDVGKG